MEEIYNIISSICESGDCRQTIIKNPNCEGHLQFFEAYLKKYSIPNAHNYIEYNQETLNAIDNVKCKSFYYD